MKKLFIRALFIVLSINSLDAATLYSRVNNGNWSTAGTWSTVGCGGVSCGCTPVNGDVVIICSGYTIKKTSGSITIGPGGNCASVTIQSGGVLNMEPSGVLTVKNGGFLTIDNGGSLFVDVFTNNNNSDGVTINGSMTVSNTFTNSTGADIVGAGTITVTGATVTNNGTVFGSATCVGSPCSFVSPLPIELLSFWAEPIGGKVELKWTTATESLNDYFTVVKTKDFLNFETVAILDGSGNSSSLINYETFDNSPYAGLSYYRLKQTDYNGDFSYSPYVAVEFGSIAPFSFELYPNPNSGNTFNMAFNSEKDQEILVVVYDLTGRESYSKIIVTSTEGENVYAIDPSQKLSKGVYLVTATSNNEIISKRLIVE